MVSGNARCDCLTRAPTGSNWLSQVEGTGWLNHIRSILTGAIKLATYVGRQGLAVLVHCSDGWDRTSQVTALGQLLLDPYYRTIKGFRILIEKEWLTVGYKFQSRTGHGKDFSTDTGKLRDVIGSSNLRDMCNSFAS